MQPVAQYWINKLQLQPHVEGGYYCRTYISDLELEKAQLPAAFTGNRPVSTAIYFLLDKSQFSALHRIASDEIWHFYSGDTLLIYEINIQGKLIEHRLGSNIEQGDYFQCVIKAGSWFGAVVTDGGEYALAGCTVSPGFHFEEFELAERNRLLLEFPQHAFFIKQLTWQEAAV